MSKTKILLLQISGCLALGTVLGVAFWWFDGGRTPQKVSDRPGVCPIDNGKIVKVYQGRWHKDCLEVIGK